IVVRYRRDPRVRFFALLGLIAFVLSLGPTLKVAGHVTGVPLPGRVLQHLPVLAATFPYRYALFVVLAAAVLVAIGFDRLHAEVEVRRGRRTAAVVVGVVAVASLFLLAPAWPYTAQHIRTPQW